MYMHILAYDITHESGGGTQRQYAGQTRARLLALLLYCTLAVQAFTRHLSPHFHHQYL